MSDDQGHALRRLEIKNNLLANFAELPDEEQTALIKRYVEQDIDILGELQRMVGKSRTAEQDIATAIDAVERLQNEKKMYEARVEGETGSGKYFVVIRGGDPRFIVSILIAIGVVVVGVIVAMKVL